MTPVEPAKSFIEQYMKLLPDCSLTEFTKILEMKSVKKQDQAILIDMFRNCKPDSDQIPDDYTSDPEAGRIRKLEKLIKKGLPSKWYDNRIIVYIVVSL